MLIPETKTCLWTVPAFDFTVDVHYTPRERLQKDREGGRAINIIELRHRVIENCFEYTASFVWGEDSDFVRPANLNRQTEHEPTKMRSDVK